MAKEKAGLTKMTGKQPSAAVNVAGETIDLRDKVVVYATDSAPHHKAGDEISVHPKLADKFIEKGFATEEPPEETDEEKGGTAE